MRIKRNEVNDLALEANILLGTYETFLYDRASFLVILRKIWASQTKYGPFHCTGLPKFPAEQ